MNPNLQAVSDKMIEIFNSLSTFSGLSVENVKIILACLSTAVLILVFYLIGRGVRHTRRRNRYYR